MSKVSLKEALIEFYNSNSLSEKEKIRMKRKYVREIEFPLPNKKGELNFVSIEEYEKWLEKNKLK